ncbi:putative von willebrand factor [Diaporthe ampelina]|uniref:Putative von willebrand factor n=1 Tax=Diaporthe ampelina TaxID=1214573 RepID=A0A0G2HWA6_9PEZI|nr:putative von willebrand factor [Diaporthe ampelina]
MDRADSWPVAQAPPDTEAGSGIDIGDLGETLSFLRCFDTIFLVDDSAAMGPYWADVKALLERITPICAKYDPDGIDLFFLNHRPKGLLSSMSFRKSGYRRIGGNTADTVAGVFDRVKPSGKCNMGARLTKLFHWYHGMLKQDEEGAALNLIVITAGAFDDDIKAPLVHVAKSLDEMGVPEHQVGVQLFQIGKPTLEVAQTFEYLDDQLHKEAHTRDIVDTTTWTGKPGSLSTDDLLKVVLGAVVKKLDERSKGMELNSATPARRFDGDGH